MSINKISLIVAAYNVENFILETLESIDSQSIPFYEVIVVEDASTDRTLNIVKSFTSLQSNMIILPQERNVGLGEVRNIGVKHATGNYLAFLDGDDLLAENAHSVMLEMLGTTPDLAIFNHGRLYGDGTLVPNKLTNLLKRADHTSVEEKIRLFENLNVAWNKIYRKQFIVDEKLKFPNGRYEDIRWNFECIMKSNRVTTNPEVIIKYRQRDGSILRSMDKSHFDIFDRWDEVWQLLKERPDLSDHYASKLEQLRFRSLRTVLLSPYRVPKGERIRFARRMTRICGPFRANRIQMFGRIATLLDLPLGPYIYFSMHSRMGLAMRKKIATQVHKGKKAYGRIRDYINLVVYRNIMVKLPLDKSLVVYQSYWGKKISCNPYAIFQHLDIHMSGQYRHVWVVRPGVDLRRTQGKAVHVREKTFRFYYYCARAGYMINNANFPTEVIKRHESVHVQTKHGTPLKFMGLDLIKKDPGELGNRKAFAKRCARWDYVISSNSHSSNVWRKAFPYNYEIIESGYPRNDRLISSTEAEKYELRRAMGFSDQQKVILYAPTFRPKSKNVLSGPVVDLTAEKKEILQSIINGLEDNEALAIRDHYFSAAENGTAESSRIVDLSGWPSTTDVLLVSDSLITDYSSIMFDYAILDRPIYILAHDMDYYERVRGTYFDLRFGHPGFFCTSPEELTRTLRARATQGDITKQRRAAFRDKYCRWDDGSASLRIVEKVFQSSSLPVKDS